MLSRCATKALIALRDLDPAKHLDISRLAAAICSAPDDARQAVLELEAAGSIAIETRPDLRRYVSILGAAPKQHRVTIKGETGDYAVTGACSIPSTKHPVQDAARALRDLGHSDHDLIVASGSVISISPTEIGAVLKPRNLPQGKYSGAHSSTFNA